MKDIYIDRFHKKYIKVRGCWEWQDYIAPNGYGHFWDGETKGYAHRFSYKAFVGDIKNDLCVDHTCRNRKCVNPKHLRLLTRGENTIKNSSSPSAKNILKTHCPKGHEYTKENTYVEKLKNGSFGRRCKKCTRSRQRARTARGYDRALYRRNIEERRKYARDWYRKKVGIIKRLPY